MSDQKRLVGRVAKLVGLVSKPELNGRIVVLSSFIAETGRYGARTLHELNSSVESLAVKYVNLDFFSINFDEQFLDATAVPGFSPEFFQGGAIVDYSKYPLPPDGSVPLVIMSSCSVRGEPLKPGQTRPVTVIATRVLVLLKDASDVVEFEDIDFNCLFPCAVRCCGGNKITFRRCHFSSQDSGAGVTDLGTEVTFECCTFENTPGSGVIVSKDGKAIFINCVVHKTGGSGVEVRTGGFAQLLHCSIGECKLACAAVYNQGKYLELKHCRVSQSKDSGVLVAEGASLVVDGCTITDCSMAGVAVEGPKTSTAIVMNSIMQSCLHGLLVQKGKSCVSVEGCTLTRNSMHGLFVGRDAMGEVVVKDTVIVENRFRNINNDGGSKSTLIRDGHSLAQDGLMASQAKDNPALTKRVEEEVVRLMRETGRDKSVFASAKTFKKAGVGTINCAACDKEEPPKEHFKKCGNCQEYCYCSRECQVSHWKEHKLVCKKKVKYPQLLDPTKSVYD